MSHCGTRWVAFLACAAALAVGSSFAIRSLAAVEPQVDAASARGTADSLAALVGQWSLTLPTGEAGWLEVELDDAKRPQVSVMWAVGGPRPVADASLADDRLRFTLRARNTAGGARRGGDIVEVRATGDTLDGALHEAADDGSTRVRPFVGKRQPPMPPRPDLSKVRWGEPITLFNGRDLDGWRVSDAAKINGWSVRDGVLANDTPKTDFGAYGDHANLRTVDDFGDFKLHIEFRVPPGGNSGIYLRGMYEVQVVDRDSRMQGIQGPGAIFARVVPTTNAGAPGDQWQTYDLTLVDRHVTVVLNGVTVVDNAPVEGCTGGALQSDVTARGPIYLQGDHTRIAYRNIVLTPAL